MVQEITNLSKKILPHNFRIALRKLNWARMYAQQSLGATPADQVYCPVAGRAFKTFIRLGDELVSPVNGARKRHRLIWLYLTRELDLMNRRLRLLHVAPEHAFFGPLRELENIDYVPGDKMVDGYSNQAGVRDIDLTALDFPDRDFDLIVCNHVLEHIPNDAAAMAEMYRVLRPGGTALITVPINEAATETYEDATITTPAGRREHFGQWDHVRWYGTDIADRLRAAGFTVELLRYAERFSAEEYRRFGLTDDLLVVAKKAGDRQD